MDNNVAIPVNHRRVEVGEVILEGDQYWSTSKHWGLMPCWGVPHANPSVLIIRAINDEWISMFGAGVQIADGHQRQGERNESLQA